MYYNLQQCWYLLRFSILVYFLCFFALFIVTYVIATCLQLAIFVFPKLLTNYLFIYFLFLIFKTVSVGRRKFSANFQLMFRLIKGLIFLTFVSILVTLIALPHMTVQDIIVCILAFMPTGWGMLLVSEPYSLKFMRILISIFNHSVHFCGLGLTHLIALET